MRLVSPATWEDPQEDVIARMGFNYKSDGRIQQLIGANVLPPVYAQSWSQTAVSDPLWRAYSRVRRNEAGVQLDPKSEGLQLRSTPRKLLGALRAAAPDSDRCFVGKVKYTSAAGVSQDIANAVKDQGLQSFTDPTTRAFVALWKRDAFAHEAEARLLYVGHVGDGVAELYIRCNLNEVVDVVTLDGLLNETERGERDRELRAAGYNGTIIKSDLYQGILWEVPLTGPPPEL